MKPLQIPPFSQIIRSNFSSKNRSPLPTPSPQIRTIKFRTSFLCHSLQAYLQDDSIKGRKLFKAIGLVSLPEDWNSIIFLCINYYMRHRCVLLKGHRNCKKGTKDGGSFLCFPVEIISGDSRCPFSGSPLRWCIKPRTCTMQASAASSTGRAHLLWIGLWGRLAIFQVGLFNCEYYKVISLQ